MVVFPWLSTVCQGTKVGSVAHSCYQTLIVCTDSVWLMHGSLMLLF